MTQLYRFRWLLASLLFCLLVLIVSGYMIIPQYQFVVKLKSQILENQHQLYLLKSKLTKNSQRKTDHLLTEKNNFRNNYFNDFIDIFAALAVVEQRSGAVISEINKQQILHLSQVKGEKLQLIVRGNFLQIRRFIAELFHQSILILNFNYQGVEPNEKLVMDILIINDFLFSASPDIVYKHNPFCLAKNIFPASFINDQTYLLSVPLMQIKMVGYIRQEKNAKAVLSLANHTVFLIEENSIIGKERGRVIKILPDQILLLINSKIIHLVM